MMFYINRLNVILFLGIILCLLTPGYCQVTVNDCPNDQTITQHRAYWEPPTATSTSGVTLTGSHTPGSLFLSEETIVTYVAEDENGNSDDTCTFKIIVIENSDAPTVQDCPSTVTVTADYGSDVATATWTPEPTAMDSNGVALDWAFRSDAPGDQFRVGDTEVYYEFVDSNQYGALCEFTVRVEETADTVGPTVECPDDMTVTIAEGGTDAVVSWTIPTPSGQYDIFIGTHEPGETLVVGTTEVSYFVEDDAGHHNECSFQITVEVMQPDTTPPVFTSCPDNIDEVVGPTQATYVVTWDTPTATDTETATADIVMSSNADSPYTVDVETSTTITYTAMDEAGNEAMCSFTITVSVDGEPTFQNCPTDMDVEMTGVSTAVSWVEPTVTDDSTVTSNYDPGDTFTGPATYTVTYTAIDPFGSTATCSFDVEIQDTTVPSIQGCPSDIVRTVSNKNTATVTWVEPTADDNSGREVVLVSDINSGASFTNGQTIQVTYTSTDSSGLESTCEFTVEVSGTTVCSDNPCENNGVCVTQNEDGFECVCVDDYFGDTCSSSGLSTLELIAISLGSLAGLLILILLLFCCCYYCCFVPYGEEERPEVIVHKLPQQHLHMGVGVLPEPRPAPVYDNRPMGERFHSGLPKKSSGSKTKRGRRFQHKSFTKYKSKVNDAITGNYGRHQDYK